MLLFWWSMCSHCSEEKYWVGCETEAFIKSDVVLWCIYSLASFLGLKRSPEFWAWEYTPRYEWIHENNFKKYSSFSISWWLITQCSQLYRSTGSTCFTQVPWCWRIDWKKANALKSKEYSSDFSNTCILIYAQPHCFWPPRCQILWWHLWQGFCFPLSWTHSVNWHICMGAANISRFSTFNFRPFESARYRLSE